MGNSNSQPDEGHSSKATRPPLRALNSSSTIKASSKQHSHLTAPSLDRQSSSSSTSLAKNGSSQSIQSSNKRRKSIELPDLDPSLTFSAATPQSSTHHTPTGSNPQPSWISSSDWKGKGKAAPPAASRGHSFDGTGSNIKALPTLRPGDDVLLSGNSNDLSELSNRTSSPLPINTKLPNDNASSAAEPSSVTSSHTADISVESDIASESDDVEYDPLHPIPLPKDTTQIPPFAQSAPQTTGPAHANDQGSALPGHVLQSGMHSTSSSTSTSALNTANQPPHTVVPPLLPPEETIIAPVVPDANALPLGSGATASTAVIVGSPFGSPALGTAESTSPILSNKLALLADPSKGHLAAEAQPSLQNALEKPEILAPLPSPTSDAAGGLGLNLPASIALPPLPSPLPAAAPLVVLAGGDLYNNPEAVEAVKAATVDLGAGAEGVPTLLTWTPGEGEGKEGGAAEGAAAPQQVYVTGTFAKGWTTKIELRKKKSQQDFSALVNLPPGPHRLKFIVDTQWKTSKNLPSGTDQEGNLINYLQVTKQLDPNIAHSDSQSRFQSPEDAARYWQAEAQWTTEIPAELIAYGEATEAEEAAMDAHDEHNRLRAERGLPPEPMPAHFQYTQQQQHASATPPSLPAQLQKGVLNQSASHPVGSGDDNSILPKPDHTVIDHLAAAPMNKGFLSVGVTKRYRRKFVTTVLYRPVPSEMAN